jgi:hypothetical protein
MELNYRVCARNTAPDSENKIHDDTSAASFGFRGGLVPGVTVYAYMTVPLVERFELDWLERGSMQVKFHQPFYDGDDVFVRAETDESSDPITVAITASRTDGITCATALATVNDRSSWLGEPETDSFPEAALASFDNRRAPSPELLIPGMELGTLNQQMRVPDPEELERIDERLPIYQNDGAPAHPFTLLSLANQMLVQNYKLGPWIHVASDLKNWSAIHDGESLKVKGRIKECFERKGHKFVVLDLLMIADDVRVVQQVCHTAIYELKKK